MQIHTLQVREGKSHCFLGEVVLPQILEAVRDNGVLTASVQGRVDEQEAKIVALETRSRMLEERCAQLEASLLEAQRQWQAEQAAPAAAAPEPEASGEARHGGDWARSGWQRWS